MKTTLQSLLIMLALSVGVNAQISNKTKHEPFQKNWYMGLYSGFSWFAGEHNTPFQGPPNMFSLYNNGSPTSNLAVGYEFNPVISIRGQLGWARYKWTDVAEIHYINWGANFSGDLMVNLNNWWVGYNANRVFDVQAFGGVGVGYRTKGDYSSSLVTPLGRFGLQGNFHATKQFDINLDLAVNLASDKMNDFSGQIFYDNFTSVQIGFTYHFKHYEARSVASALAPLIKIKEVIKHDTVVVKEQPTPITKIITKSFNKNIFFLIGISAITDYNQRQTIEEAANFLKTYPDATIQIDGYADKDTGTKQINMKLSKQRANNIVNVLIKKFGIDASRINAVGHGTVPQIFQTNPKNRVATLKATAEIKETSY